MTSTTAKKVKPRRLRKRWLGLAASGMAGGALFIGNNSNKEIAAEAAWIEQQVQAAVIKLSDINDLGDLKDLFKGRKKGDLKSQWEEYEFLVLRRVVLEGRVNKESVDAVIAKMRILNALEPGKSMELHITSPGGSVEDGMRLINQMQIIESPVNTICNATAASMGAYILIAGVERKAMPQCRVMIHEIGLPESSGINGKVSDMAAQLDNLERWQGDLYKLVARKTGMRIEDVRAIASRDHDYFYGAEEAKKLGFVDVVLPDRHAKNPAPGSRVVPMELLPRNETEAYYRGFVDGSKPSKEEPTPE